MQEFTVTVRAQDGNAPPAIVSTPPLSATLGRPYRYDASATDPDGDPVSWSLDAGPRGLSVDPLTGTLRWVPGADQVGSHTVVLRAQDTLLASTTQTFTLDVRAANLPPDGFCRCWRSASSPRPNNAPCGARPTATT